MLLLINILGVAVVATVNYCLNCWFCLRCNTTQGRYKRESCFFGLFHSLYGKLSTERCLL